eukprot:gene4555-7939_t
MNRPIQRIGSLDPTFNMQAEKRATVINLGNTAEELFDDFDSNKKIDNSSRSPNFKKILLLVIPVMFVLLMIVYAGHVLGWYKVNPSQTPKDYYKIFAVSDRDSYSYDKKTKSWKSQFVTGNLMRNPSTGKYQVKWNKKTKKIYSGKLVEGARGMELSELQFWNDKLYSFCDRTGIVYELDGSRAMARYILPEGDAKTSQKGFKSEWATIKDGNLVVGSIGKEWTDGKGNVLNKAPMFIKIIHPNGKIDHIDWSEQYNKLREKTKTLYPGYMVHEAVGWSDYHKKWFFLPRRVSREKYDDAKELRKGSNTVIIANENFSDIEVKKIGVKTPIRGFSSFKFIPGRPNEIIALKSAEENKMQQAFITVFNLNGEVLLEETLIGNEKYEGIEIR